jgi:hypothetical protein
MCEQQPECVAITNGLRCDPMIATEIPALAATGRTELSICNTKKSVVASKYYGSTKCRGAHHKEKTGTLT